MHQSVSSALLMSNQIPIDSIPLSRRELLTRAGGGAGLLALAGLLGDEGLLTSQANAAAASPSRWVASARVRAASPSMVVGGVSATP